MPGVGSRDSFKQQLRHKSRTELFADLLEVLFITIKDLGIDPMAVVSIVNERALQSQADRQAVQNELRSLKFTPGHKPQQTRPKTIYYEKQIGSTRNG